LLLIVVVTFYLQKSGDKTQSDNNGLSSTESTGDNSEETSGKNTMQDADNQEENSENVKIEDVSPKYLLAENDNFAVYFLKPRDEENLTFSGKMLIYNKNTKKITSLENQSFLDSAEVFSDSEDKYIVLSDGTSPERSATVISVSDGKQIGDELSIVGGVFFWENHLLYTTVEEISGSEETRSLADLNLIGGKSTIVKKGDSKNRFSVTKIVGSQLYFDAESVDNVSDWDSGSAKITEQVYDLNSLK